MTRVVFYLFVGLVVCVPPSAAGSKCAGITNDLDRLGCYDSESGRTPTTATVTATPGNWRVEKTTSKLTDKTDVVMQLMSEGVVTCRFNRDSKISLILYCKDNTTSLVLNTGCHMTSSKYNDYGDVDFRIDKEKARKLSMTESTNNKALGLWSGGRSIPVIKSMFGKSQVVVRATPYGENPFTAAFNIAGLSQAIKPLRKACGW